MKVSVNSNKSIVTDHKIILQKKFLNKVYREFYQRFQIPKLQKPVIEIGSGGGFLKSVYPNVMTSDVVAGPNINKVFSATKMPFKKNSVGSFVMLNTFHHIKDVEEALSQMERCLKQGGRIIMIEPFNSFLGRIYYQNFHSEGFDIQSGWEIAGKGRMEANNALPWIVFFRDRKIFEQKFPKLKIKRLELHTPFKFVVSGGLSKPQLIPTFLYPIVSLLEILASPFNRYLAFFVTIELEKIR